MKGWFMGTLEDLGSKKAMTTEIKKLNSVISLLHWVVTLLLVIICVHIASSYYFYNDTLKEIAAVKQDVKDTKKAVHYRYFNITNSLQDIHHVKIDTHFGKIVK